MKTGNMPKGLRAYWAKKNASKSAPKSTPSKTGGGKGQHKGKSVSKGKGTKYMRSGHAIMPSVPAFLGTVAGAGLGVAASNTWGAKIADYLADPTKGNMAWFGKDNGVMSVKVAVGVAGCAAFGGLAYATRRRAPIISRVCAGLSVGFLGGAVAEPAAGLLRTWISTKEAASTAANGLGALSSSDHDRVAGRIASGSRVAA